MLSSSLYLHRIMVNLFLLLSVLLSAGSAIGLHEEISSRSFLTIRDILSIPPNSQINKLILKRSICTSNQPCLYPRKETSPSPSPPRRRPQRPLSPNGNSNRPPHTANHQNAPSSSSNSDGGGGGSNSNSNSPPRQARQARQASPGPTNGAATTPGSVAAPTRQPLPYNVQEVLNAWAGNPHPPPPLPRLLPRLGPERPVPLVQQNARMIGRPAVSDHEPIFFGMVGSSLS